MHRWSPASLHHNCAAASNVCGWVDRTGRRVTLQQAQQLHWQPRSCHKVVRVVLQVDGHRGHDLEERETRGRAEDGDPESDTIMWRDEGDTHPAESGHRQRDGRFEVFRTLLGQSGDEAGGSCHHSLQTKHTHIYKQVQTAAAVLFNNKKLLCLRMKVLINKAQSVTRCWSLSRCTTRAVHSPMGTRSADVLLRRSRHSAALCFTLSMVSLTGASATVTYMLHCYKHTAGFSWSKYLASSTISRRLENLPGGNLESVTVPCFQGMLQKKF